MSDVPQVEAEIAVVIPTFNRREALMALLAALESQTVGGERFEVIVVDDGSNDGTARDLEALSQHTSLQLVVLHTPNRGPARARNLGWRSSTAPLVAFIDDDCRPEPAWLQAGVEMFDHGPRVGVVQGCTALPIDASLGDWTITREVSQPTPYFESHNIFYRREALEATGGFDEGLRWYGEDTALGWAVLERGWQRGFTEKACVMHELTERGLGWHARNGYVCERNLVAVAARFPGFRRAAFWRPWAFHRHDVHFAVAVAGVVLALWKRPALLLVIPYLRVRDPGPHHRRWLLIGERVVVDAAAFAGRKVGSIRSRCLVL